MAQLEWDAPTGDQNRTTLNVSCEVIDNETGNPISGYPVTFYDGDLGYSIGSNDTNDSGIAQIQYDYSGALVGPDELSCEFNDEPSLNYETTGSTTVSETVDFYGYLNATISDPASNQILYRGNGEMLDVTVVDEFDNVPLDENGNTASLFTIWDNSSDEQIATGINTIWNIPSDYSLGDELLNVTVSENYYYSSNDSVDVEIRSYAEINMDSPASDTYPFGQDIDINCTVTDTSLATTISSYDVNFYNDGGLLGIVSTDVNGVASFPISTTTLGNGDHLLSCNISDDPANYYDVGLSDEDSVSISVDGSNPEINYDVSTDSNGTYNKSWIFVNVTVIEDNIDSVLLFWNGVAQSFDTNESTAYYSNISSLSDGEHTFYAFVNDTIGNENQTSSRNITLDTGAPNLIIDTPLSTYYNTTSIDLNYTASDQNRDSCWYSLDGGPQQVIPGCANMSLSPSEGVHTIEVGVNDTVGFDTVESVTFTTDYTSPSVSISSPQNTVEYTAKDIDLNYTVSDNTLIDSCWYSIDSQSVQQLPSCQNTSISGLSNDNHTIVVFTNDTAGNVNSDSHWFEVNYSVLTATPVYPLNNSAIASQSIDVNVTTNKQATECNYSLDGGAFIPMTNYTLLDWNATVTGLSQGDHTVRFTCTDTINTSTTDIVHFTVDVLAPTITYKDPTPQNNDGRAVDWTLINISLDEPADIVNLEWENESAIANVSMISANETSYYINMTNLNDGTYNFTVYANDSLGNLGSAETRTVVIATIAPKINIDSPMQTDYSNNVVDLNVSSNMEITKWWYVFNDRNFSLVPNTTIAGVLGANELTVYGRDIYGKVGNASINFIVNDTTMWNDEFDSLTGIGNSTNVKTTGSAEIDYCWPVPRKDDTSDFKRNSCWNYRKPLTVSSSSELTNQQVLLSLDLSSEESSGLLQSACEDIRLGFLNETSGEDQSLPYWIDDCSDYSDIKVWTKIPVISTTGTTVHVYYGNNKSSDASNGTQVFELFDDFDTVSSTEWGSNAVNWNSEDGIATPTVAGSGSRLTSTYTTGSEFATELFVAANSTSGAGGYFGIGNGAGTKYLRLYLEPESNQVNLYNGANNQQSVDSSKQQHYTVETDFTTDSHKLYINNSNTPDLSITGSSSGSQSQPTFYSYYVGGLEIDTFAVRKLPVTSITTSSLGSQQRPVVNATMKTNYITPDVITAWDSLTVQGSFPSGTSAVFRLLNQTGGNICSNLSYAQVSSGFDICSDAGNQSLALETDFITDSSTATPLIDSLQISWMEEDLQPPVVSLVSPAHMSGDNDGDITFSYQVTDIGDVQSCTLYVDDNSLQTNISSLEGTTRTFSESGFLPADYTWNVECTDTNGNSANSTQRTVTVIDTTVFDQATDLSTENISQISDFTVENSLFGSVNYTAPVNLIGGANISSLINISTNNVTVNTITEPRINESAIITMYGLDYKATPLILKDNTLCLTPACQVNSYAPSTGTLVFNVSGFSSYTTINNSALNISDDVDKGLTKRAQENVTFYANYTFFDSGDSINGSGVYCEIQFEEGTWTTPETMSYDENERIYTYNHSFATKGSYNWSVYCNGTAQDGEPINLTDNVTVNEFIAPDTTTPDIEYVEPTDNNTQVVSRTWSYINVSANDTNDMSGFIDMDNQLLGYWSFDEYSGSTIVDHSSFENNATLYSGASVSGGVYDEIRGNYSQLDGDDDYVAASYDQIYDVEGEFTLEMWVKEGSQQNSWATLANRNGDNGFNLQHNNANTEFEFAVDTSEGRQFINQAPPGGINQGEWYHVAGVYDGSNIRLYVNGEEIDSGSHSGTVNPSTSDLYVGARYVYGSTDREFNGSIDEVKYWNRSLSPEEINASYILDANAFKRNVTSLVNGTHSFDACVIDKGGNKNCTETRSIIIDQNIPEISYVPPTPEDNEYTSENWVYVNVSVVEQNLDTVTLDWNGTNETLSCQGSSPNHVCGINKTGLVTGNYTIKGYANDSAGFENNTLQRNVIVDLDNPLATIQSPGNNSYHDTTNSLDLNYTVSDNYNIDTCSYSIDNAAWQEIPGCNNITLPSLTNDVHNITLRVNDTAGNVNTTTHHFEINLSSLDIIPSYPINTTFHNESTIDLNISVNRPVTSCNYTLDSGIAVSMTNTSSVDWTASATSLSEGEHIANYTCDDGMGTQANEIVNFTIDTTQPTLTLSTPVNENHYNSQDIDVNYTATDQTNLTCSYSLDEGVFNTITDCQNFTLSTLSQGRHNITLKVVDEALNENTVFANFTVDTILPNITIESPHNTSYNHTEIPFNITTNEPTTTCEYDINNTGNVSMNAVSQTQYNASPALTDGKYNVTFHCNDTAGNSNEKTISYVIDTIKPSLDFIPPTKTDGATISENRTTFNLSIHDATTTSSYIDFNNELVGYWNFETMIDSTTVKDSSSYGFNGTLQNTVQLDTNKNIRGRYATFNGIDQDIKIPHQDELDITGNVSVEAWVKEGNQSNSWANIVNRNGNDGYRIQHNQENTEFEFGAGGDYVSGALGEGILQGKWYHVVGTYDGQTLRLYVNGELVSSKSETGPTQSSTADLYIGSYQGLSRQFNGSIDEVKIWNTTLTPEQINASYQSKATVALNKSDLQDGTYEYDGCAIDSAGNYNCTTQTITISSTPDIDLYVESMKLNETSIVENDVVDVILNITNNGTAVAENVTVDLNISIWRGTKQVVSSLNDTIDIIGDSSQEVTFEWMAGLGTYYFDAYLDSNNSISEFNETNNNKTINTSVSAWQLLYGDYNYTYILGDATNKNFINWSNFVAKGNVYYSDVDANYYPFDLKPLNGTNDFQELDQALGMTYFNDSIKKVFDVDNNGMADQTTSFTVGGSQIENVPIIDSTSAGTFITGLLWDSADGGSEYDGSQDVIVITKLNESTAGLFGTYDYEVRLPVLLRNQTGITNQIERYDELQ
ncbi:MAG: DUF2341 domain-containing protein [Nanobdellota archaeon]